jgi:hypothetical protein
MQMIRYIQQGNAMHFVCGATNKRITNRSTRFVTAARLLSGELKPCAALTALTNTHRNNREISRFKSLPLDVSKRYEKLKDIISISGPGSLGAIRGFRDEALRGRRLIQVLDGTRRDEE